VLNIERTPFLDDSATRDALRVITTEQHRLADDRLHRWLQEANLWRPGWRDSASDSVYVTHLTQAQLEGLSRELNEVVMRYVALAAAADSRHVEVQINVFPTGDPE
jgi:hypothetical protein